MRPGGRGAGEREGLRRSRPRPSPSCLSSTRFTFTSLGGGVRWGGGAWRPRTAVPSSLPCRRQPVLALGSAPAARPPPPVHLGQRTPQLASPSTAPRSAQPSSRPLLSRSSPSRPASVLLLLPALEDSVGCGPETFLPVFSEPGTTVICDCLLTRGGSQTLWTGLFFFSAGACPARTGRGKRDTGQRDSGAAGLQSPRLGTQTPAASPPPRTRHVRASHGRGPSPTTLRPPPARPGPPHRLDTRGLRVLIGRRRNPAPFPEGVVPECCGCQRQCAHGGSGVDR